MEPEATESHIGGASPLGSRRACDQCRLRKIRCDKDSPCSNCRIARRICSSTGAGQKPKEPRQRVLISSQYERKIDQIEERLGGIEHLLRNLTTNPSGTISETSRFTPNTSSPEKKATPPSHGDGPAGLAGEPESPPSTVLGPEEDENYEGTASLAGHTVFAGDFLQNVVERTSMLGGGSGIGIGSSGGGGGSGLGDGLFDFNNSNPKIDDALAALRRIVDMQKTTASGRHKYPHHEVSRRNTAARVNLRDLPMPPMSLVIDKLREMKHSPSPAMQAVVYVFTGVEQFTDRCRRVYFATEEPSEGAFIIVNAGLASLFFEAGYNEPDATARARFQACRDMCIRNLEVTLSQLSITMPATLENIEALTTSASYCIDLSRPSLAWTLTTMAVHMCRTLGLHQAAPEGRGPADAIANAVSEGGGKEGETDSRLLFWCTYMLDKGLSLRMGRASTLQDYDISQTVAAEWALGPFPTSEVLNLWIGHARNQGRIYERLYSPAALAQPEYRRVEEVKTITAEIKHMLAEARDLHRRLQEEACSGDGGTPIKGSSGQRQTQHSSSDGSNSNSAAAAALPQKQNKQGARPATSPEERELYTYLLKSDEVSYLSSLTLAYRALPPMMGSRSRTFADECIDAARATMRSHQETMAMVDDRSLKIGHLHWTILYAPFIPFIVIFCLVIETGDAEDLQQLADFIASLDVAKDVSRSVGKLHHLCQVLYNVAQLYVEAKAQQQQQQQQRPVVAEHDQDMVPPPPPPPLGDEFDMYLSQLGFMPADLDMVNADLPVDDHTRSVAQSTQLGDWFSGNNHMLGLLEEDLQGPNAFGFLS